MHGIGTRDQLRQTFDRVAQLYDQMRPSYPAAVFDDVIALSGVNADSQVLEIGCGTGHATQEFAERGLAIDCVELGENMADLARTRLARFPRVRIQIADFDRCATDSRYDLAYSAAAYHWLDPASREQKISTLLRPSGWLAFWRNRHIRNGSSDDFVSAMQEIYAAAAPQLVNERGGLPGPSEVLELEREQLSPRFFEEPVYRVHFWSLRASASDYVRMLATHSDHQLLEERVRQRLFDRIETLIATRYGGSVVKDYATVLQMARSKS